MRTETISPQQGTILLVELPKSATMISVQLNILSFAVAEDGVMYLPNSFSLPDGRYEFLGLISNGEVQFDCSELVEKKMINGDNYYRRYNATKSVMNFPDGDMIESGNNYSHIINAKVFTDKDSFLSLLSSHGIEVKNKYGDKPDSTLWLTKYGKSIDYGGTYENALEQWQSEQSKVWSQIAVLKVIDKS